MSVYNHYNYNSHHYNYGGNLGKVRFLNIIGSQRFSVNGYRIMQTIKGY